MYTRLFNFLEQKCILYNKQFGFRSQHSTEQAILTITDKIQNAIENRNYSSGIFLDFSKAIDTVHHGILINKLEKYGIWGVAKDLFVSYLTDRQHYVSVNNIMSNFHKVNCGIPKDLFWAPSYLFYISTIPMNAQIYLISITLLMIPIYFMKTRTYQC